MKKSTRLFITGSIQDFFFGQFIRENADKLNIKGFLRKLQDGRTEIFLEGDLDKVDQMTSICKRGPRHAQIRKIEQKPESFQDFKTFKILKL